MIFFHARCRNLVCGALALAVPVVAGAQNGSTSLEATIRQFSATSIEGYIQPMADVLVANLGMGYFSPSPVPGRFSLTFEAIVMSAMIDDELKQYTATLPNGFDPQTASMPTIFGGTAPTITHASNPSLTWRGSDGLLDNSETKTLQKIPLIGDIPVLGELFRSQQFQRQVTDLMFIVTVNLVRPSNRDVLPELRGLEGLRLGSPLRDGLEKKDLSKPGSMPGDKTSDEKGQSNESMPAGENKQSGAGSPASEGKAADETKSPDETKPADEKRPEGSEAGAPKSERPY